MVHCWLQATGVLGFGDFTLRGEKRDLPVRNDTSACKVAATPAKPPLQLQAGCFLPVFVKHREFYFHDSATVARVFQGCYMATIWVLKGASSSSPNTYQMSYHPNKRSLLHFAEHLLGNVGLGVGCMPMVCLRCRGSGARGTQVDVFLQKRAVGMTYKAGQYHILHSDGKQ